MVCGEVVVGWVFALTLALSPRRGGLLGGGGDFAPGSGSGAGSHPTLSRGFPLSRE